MGIELLKTFLAIREIRHFGKVAAMMNITQAAVSLRIKQLEIEIQAPLFYRYRNNLQLTDTGEKLVFYAENIVAEWEKAQLEFSLRKHSKKILRLGAMNGFCALLLNKSLGPVHQRISEVTLRVESHDEETLRSRLREKRIDLGLLYDPLRDKEFGTRAISSIELVLVSTVKGQSIADTLNGEYVAVEWGSFFNSRFLTLNSQMPNPVMLSTDTAIALRFILDNGGSAYLPYRLVQEYLGSALHIVEEAEILQQPIYAIYNQSSSLLNEIEQTLDVIMENSKPEFASLEDIVLSMKPGKAKRLSSVA